MILIADSGATKTTWCLLGSARKKMIHTQGISPYFLNTQQIIALLQKELLPSLKEAVIEEVFYYGTGCSNPANISIVKSAIKKLFPAIKKITVDHDMMGIARAACGNTKGVACILGTGSNSCVFNGKKIIKNNPAPGFILGDEGSGAYLGKKVIQHFIYKTFDEELMHRFNLKFDINYTQILHNVYKEPLPNRYLASFAPFLSENRGHYMIENIIEDGLSDFFFTHLYKYNETWTLPIHFVGSIGYHFKDVLQELCSSFELQLGKVIKAPIDGLIAFHS
ncbi:MAG: N-acetylglucosamine kinase [Bacteroidota bacterium]